MKFETLNVVREDQVERVTLNRPTVLNALNKKMIEELYVYFNELSERTDVRVVVLQGAGSAFCAGLDLGPGNELESDEQGARPTVQTALKVQKDISRIVLAMRRCPQPIISLIHGAACGGGFSLALASDIRIAATDAKFNCAYIRIGLGGCDIGSSYFLPRIAGASVAAELILTGKFIHADRAERVGLVSKIVDPEELAQAADEDIEYMLTTSPLGLRLSKDALNLNIDATSLEAAVALEDRNQTLTTQTSDLVEGVTAFLLRRPPEWKDQ